LYTILFLAVASMALCLMLTPVVRDWAMRRGFFDSPAEDRKVHEHPVPRLGGVAIAFSYVLPFLLLALMPLHGAAWFGSRLGLVMPIFPAVLVIFLVGLADDFWGLKPSAKIGGQLLASLLAVWGGVEVTSVGGYDLPSGLGVVVTICWLIACTNAFNLIDGIDGLASGVGLFATVTILISGLLEDNVALAIATVPLAGALIGFLRYNFNPASIFLGDSGSYLIGFLLACFGVIWSQKSATLLGMTAPLMALALPLLDTGIAVVRRFLRREPIFGADRGHIHHRLLDRGLTPRMAALVLYGVCGLGAGFSLLLQMANQQFSGVIVVLFCATAWIGVQHLGYVEFGMARKILAQGSVRSVIHAELSLRDFEEKLRRATRPEDAWETIVSGAEEFGFSGVEARLDDRRFCSIERSLAAAAAGGTSPVAAWSNTAVRSDWSLRAPISDEDYVELSRRANSQSLASVVAPFADILQTVLREKKWAPRVEPKPEPVPLRMAAASGGR